MSTGVPQWRLQSLVDDSHYPVSAPTFEFGRTQLDEGLKFVSRVQVILRVGGGMQLTLASVGGNATGLRRGGVGAWRWMLKTDPACSLHDGDVIALDKKLQVGTLFVVRRWADNEALRVRLNPAAAADLYTSRTGLAAAVGSDTGRVVLTAAAVSDTGCAAAETAEPVGTSPKRARTEPLLTAADAEDLATRLATQGLHHRHQAGVKLLPADAPAVQRYELARKWLRSVDPALVGFQLLEDPTLLSVSEARRVLAFCESIEWEPRLGSGGRSLPGTKRKSFGVATEGSTSYHIASGSATPLPPLLAALGDRLLRHCRTLRWPHASTAIDHTASFEQAYVQVYPPPGGPSNSVPSSTLGFHFDDRKDYGELIVGVTLCGTAKLLLASTNGHEFVDDVAKELGKPNVISVGLAPRSVYAMTGLSRYDLRHAVVNDGDDLRVSVTFRSCPKARGARGGSARPPPPAAAPAAAATTAAVPVALATAPTPAAPAIPAALAPLAAGSGSSAFGSPSFGSSASFGQHAPSPFVQQHAAWFQGSQAVSMNEAIAEGTHAACFETPVADLLRPSHRRGGGGGGGEGGGGNTDPVPIDLSSDEEDAEGEEGSEEAAKAGAELRREIERRASAPCGSKVCRFDGRCFRREPQHWLDHAHPCELAKDYCPNLAMGRPCFNKGPEFESHNALFSHGPLPSALEAAAAAAAASAASATNASSSSSSSSSSKSRGGLAGYRAHLQPMSIRELKAEVARRGIVASLCLERGDIIESLVSCGAPTSPAGTSASPPPPPPVASWSGQPLPSLPTRGGASKGKPLARRFVVNPFSTLDAKQGAWQERKREWHSLVRGRGSIPAPLGAALRRLAPRAVRTLAHPEAGRSSPRGSRSSTRASAVTRTCSALASRGCFPSRRASTARASSTPS